MCHLFKIFNKSNLLVGRGWEIPLVTCILLWTKSFFQLISWKATAERPSSSDFKTSQICSQTHLGVRTAGFHHLVHSDWWTLKGRIASFMCKRIASFMWPSFYLDWKNEEILQVKCFLALLPCLPRFCSLVCAQYHGVRQTILVGHHTWKHCRERRS